jgi:hypothetical protein
MTDPDRDESEPLPSRPSAGGLIGSIIGTLDQALTNRPRPVAAIEERYTEPWASRDGFTVDGLDEPMEREEPPDTSGAKL